MTSAETSAKTMNSPATTASPIECPVDRASSTWGTYQGRKTPLGAANSDRTSLLTSYQPSGPDAIVPTDLPPKFENDASFTAHGAPTRDQRSWGVVIADEPAQDGPGRKGR